MINKDAKKTFEKYNPKSAVKPCPKERATFQKLLDEWAFAAVNLYGVISVSDFVEIFNGYHKEQTNADEVFTLLLPMIREYEDYCFYKDYIVHFFVMPSFDMADYLITEQEGKTRYLPTKDLFPKYAEYDHIETTELSVWDELFEWTLDTWFVDENGKELLDDHSTFMEELSFLAKMNFVDVSFLTEILSGYGIDQKDKKLMTEFFDLFMNAHQNTRNWCYKGWTENEIKKLMRNEHKQVVNLTRRKIGVNEPCPCGSGKKYKKCCMLIKNAKTSYLTPKENELFFRTYFGLLGFVNERKKVVDIEDISSSLGEQVFEIRKALFKNPSLISDYLKSEKLPVEEVELLTSWRDHHIIGTFTIWKHTPEYSIFCPTNDKKKTRFYAVKGNSEPLSEVIQLELPVIVDAILFPFKDKIISDGMMTPYPDKLNEKIKEKAMQEINEQIEKYGMITRFGNDTH